MRQITKTHPPTSLRDWVKTTKTAQNRSYKDLPANVMRDLKQQLVAEQFCLCAYTGRRIAVADSHIEHIKPQNACTNREDVDYRNVVACFPGDGGDISGGYGASTKGGWWDEPMFVSPLFPNCERRFKFVWSGKVHARDADAPAAETIRVLGLDADQLVRLRRAAINDFFGFGSRRGEISKVEARRLLERIDHPEGGKLRPFCFVFKQLLEKYVKG